ncbi:DUF4031 domain-containing protein [Leucobacter zeae]|nr:DUF4031 domain-containing protein [Leucobacter zeae]
MAILIDPPAWPAHGTLWSHLVSDADTDELHAFAKRLGVPRRGFDLDHYDVPTSLHERAVALGARPVTAKELLRGLQDAGLRVRQVERGIVAPIRRRQYLESEWMALDVALGLAGGALELEAWRALGGSLIARWNEPHRRYHDERHLEDVLLSLDQLATRGETVPPATLLAAWFHDAVYAGAPSDEADSAALAAESLAPFVRDAALAERVSAMVVATAPGREVRDPDPALALLLDADLAIFAAPPHRYAEYAAAVREEFARVPDAEFAAARARILAAYLDRPAIYRTGTARQLWEDRARVNVAAEIARLTAPLPGSAA